MLKLSAYRQKYQMHRAQAKKPILRLEIIDDRRNSTPINQEILAIKISGQARSIITAERLILLQWSRFSPDSSCWPSSPPARPWRPPLPAVRRETWSTCQSTPWEPASAQVTCGSLMAAGPGSTALRDREPLLDATR